MLKVLLGLGLIGLVVGVELNTSSSVATSAQVLVKNQPSETHQLSDNKTHLAESTKDESNDDLGSQNHPFEPSDLLNMPEDGSMGNFKYYFALLFVSTLSVISIIVFKAMRYAYQYFCETIEQKTFYCVFRFRLSRSRAEAKYGVSSSGDRSEVEPLGKSKWLEESSDENEDEIFDINFLKNSRSQNSVWSRTSLTPKPWLKLICCSSIPNYIT